MVLVLNKSITLGLVRPSVAIFQVISFAGIGWGFYSIINLFGWWSLIAIPITWIAVLLITLSFLKYLTAMNKGYSQGEELLLGQGGYGILVLIFFIASAIPYLIHWFTS